MGLFGGKNRRKQAAPYKRRSGDERIALKKAKYLDRLQQTNPQRYAQLMEEELFGKADGTGGPPTLYDQLSELKDLRPLLKDLGMIGGRGGSGDDVELVKALAPALGPLIESFLRNRSGTPAASPVPAADVRVSTPFALPVPAPTGDTEMSLMVTFVTNKLSGQTPEQAAAWLVGLNDKFAADVVARIRATPDTAIVERIGELATLHPEAKQLSDWLLALPRREWLMAVVRAIKANPAQAVTGL